jgi:hypothetical protein
VSETPSAHDWVRYGLSAKETVQNAAENFERLPSAKEFMNGARSEPVSEHDEYTQIEVDPQIQLSLHQAELFGPRYSFYLLIDNRSNFKLSVEQARKLHSALGELLAKVEDE